MWGACAYLSLPKNTSNLRATLSSSYSQVCISQILSNFYKGYDGLTQPRGMPTTWQLYVVAM